MTPTLKPQAIAARAYVQALHDHRDGKISTAEKDALGDRLNAAIEEHGKP
jgi:hypothetical protein